MEEKPDAIRRDATELLDAPVPRWKTTLAKISGGISMVTGSIYMACGAVYLFRGGRTTTHNTWTGESFSMSNGVLGAISLISGAAGTVFGKAVWDSASSAAKMRNYLSIVRYLDKKEGAGKTPGM